MSPGDIIGGKYRLERPLGEGGMGVVWAATHLVTHKSLALKLVHAKNDDPASYKRALREARAACAIAHPNVVAVHDVLESEDAMPVLVMDLLRGESLRARLERETTIPVLDAVGYAKQILAGLEAAHAAGIIHRDLKPDNVFLTEGGGLVVLDFGVAKLRGTDPATKETNRLTETGAMIGTPHYMAPEQAFAEGEIDARADLWAVGAVLFECLVGTPPTEGENLGQILKVLATGKIPRLVERVPTAPPPLLVLVDRLLSIDRADRPASAGEAIEALDAIADLPDDRLAVSPSRASRAAARPDTPAPATRTAPHTVRGRSSPAMLAVIAAVLTLGIFTAWRLTRTPITIATAPPPPPAATTTPITAEPPIAIAPPSLPPPSASVPVDRPATRRAPALAPARASASAPNPLLSNVPY